jgi:anti-sigma regulatory factor (Ser/Thr protein kinase)
VHETFRPDASEVARARRHVAAVLRSWDREADLTAIELAVSELVSNAMIHGSGAVEVALLLDGDRLRLEVHDGGTTGDGPRLRDLAPGGPHPGGWGLRFVDQLADVWGSDASDGHTLVWMERRTAAGGDLRRKPPPA